MQEVRQNIDTKRLRAYLMTEGAPDSAEILETLSRYHCETVTPGSALEALELLQRRAPDIIVLDNISPGCGTVGVVHHLRDTGVLGATVPVLAVACERCTAQEREMLLESGIWEVLLPPLSVAEFKARLNNFLPARIAYIDAVEASFMDPVTGIYNERGLFSRVTELAGQCARQGSPLSCIAFSLKIADRGTPQSVSETQLAEVGAGLRRVGRAADIMGYAPDADFVLLAPGATGANARQLAKRLTRSISSLLSSHGVECDLPWVGRVLQPSRGGEKLGEGLLADTLNALHDLTSEKGIPVSL